MRKIAFITGATSGFGTACAKKFHSLGWNIVLTGRRADRLASLAEEYGQERVHTLCFDMRDKEALERAVDSLPEGFREVDVLVNNAGLALGLEPAQSCDTEDWDAMVDTNIKGLIHCTRAILPGMVARKSGHVINLGSVAGSWPYVGGNVYGATKAFVQQFSRNLRCDLHGTGVRVTNIEPGLAESEFSVVRFGGDAEKAAKVYEGTAPLTPEDIAESIWWVASLPVHVNINALEIMPTCQSWAPLSVFRE
ncbi:SDR family oxidoreductase [Oleidesulfovibrio sp.]|uniref:SDR family oxidoreductase n=1 Tax=Oleidesulfovibrio sp. TaxID=2909707 RepID=UPI003A838DE8